MKKAIIETEKGDIVLELFPNEAPGTVCLLYTSDAADE